MKTKIIFVAVATLLASGCGQSERGQPATVASDPVAVEALKTLNELQQLQRDDAVAAKDKLFQSLLGELTSSIGENGVAESIEVCKTKAPELAKTVGEESNLKIGRTSFLLRNDASVPPAWAASFVKDRVTAEVDVDLGEDRLGILLPIRLKAACIKCHGQPDGLDTGVKEAIAAHYPNDIATGFAEGDLRGYFWVEVPARIQEPQPTER